ncbi:hypothetical protein EOM57_03240 [Candidatus Saccharibacteria bacterium]|nr:hypothetical protein [Candidatus Saccharibacteria bacterium]
MIFRKKQKYARDYVSSFILGAVDGIVTTFAVVAASAGVGVSSTVVVILGIANLVADGFSMGSGAFLARQAENSNKLSRRNLKPAIVGGVTFVAFLAIGMLSLIPYMIDIASQHDLKSSNIFLSSAIITGCAFLFIGYVKGIVTRENPIVAALITFMLGATAASLAYFAGDILGALLGVSV